MRDDGMVEETGSRRLYACVCDAPEVNTQTKVCVYIGYRKTSFPRRRESRRKKKMDSASSAE